MPGHDVIVIGGSAGSLDPLKALFQHLPADLPAALCITRHLSPDSRNVLPYLLTKLGRLSVTEAVDGEPLQRGHIYVAPPDFHLLLTPDGLRVTRSPTENRFRPAIDPLFRSAAVAYGPRVVGGLLSGGLDDGTAGLWAIKQRGGIAVIQDPHDAQHPSMPRSAQTYVPIDYALPAPALAPVLVRLAHAEVDVASAPPVPKEMAMENHVALEDNALEQGLLDVAPPSLYTCPECHGVLLQLKAGHFLRFRCHTGHSYSVRSLFMDLTESIDDALWNTVRSLNESVLLIGHLAAHLRQEGHDPETAARYLAHADLAKQQAAVVRQLVLQRRALPPESRLDPPPEDVGDPAAPS
jgi:two-component system chemotaxis response regulator CheB